MCFLGIHLKVKAAEDLTLLR